MGNVSFLSPVFETKEITDKAILNAADELDRELQAYFIDRGNQKPEDFGAEAYPAHSENQAEQVNAEMSQRASDQATVAATVPDIDDDDIPF